MNKTEQDYYQELAPIQKDMVDALKQLGFVWTRFTNYKADGFYEVNVRNFKEWSSLLKHMHNDGRNQKAFEIQKALGFN